MCCHLQMQPNDEFDADDNDDDHDNDDKRVMLVRGL